MTPVVVRVGDRELEGVVRPGESWRAAARRTCATQSAEPVALDLSGEVKRFTLDEKLRVDLRPMTTDDLATAVRWRSSPAVRKWWNPGEISTDEAITTTYAERVDGRSPTRMWVVEANGHAVGFVQDYRIGDYPEYAAEAGDAGPDADAIGVDYAIGDDAWRGRGLGVRMLWAWALRARDRFPGATTYFAAPDHRNAASLRILAKAGFAPGASFAEPHDDGRVDTVVGCRLDVPTVLGSTPYVERREVC